MVSINSVIIAGNLTKDPELRYTNTGTSVTTLNVAVNEKYKKNDEWVDDVLFVKVTAWSRQAETAAEYLTKGRPVLIEGRLKASTWETEAGEKRTQLEVVASRIHFLSSGSKESEDGDLGE